MGAGFRPKENQTKGQRSTSPCQKPEVNMTPLEDVEILLVEDNPNDVELTLRALQKQNLSNKVFVVKDGAEALDFMFATGAYAQRKIEKRPRVVLLDLKLPKVDGIEVLRRIKADSRTSHIPVVMLTSSQ